MECYWNGQNCLLFRDVAIICGEDTLAERHEKMVFRLERITRAGYQVSVQWKCEFEVTLCQQSELLEAVDEHLPFRIRYALCGVLSQYIWLHYTLWVRMDYKLYRCDRSVPEVIQVFEVSVSHPTNHVGETCIPHHKLPQKYLPHASRTIQM
jgi:hypothetical protein